MTFKQYYVIEEQIWYAWTIQDLHQYKKLQSSKTLESGNIQWLDILLCQQTQIQQATCIS